MRPVSIRPVWTILDAEGRPLPPRLIELLCEVANQGSLLAAARQMELSYRHAWDLVRQGELQLGSPLLHMARGKGSSLTALAEKMVWADYRIQARLKPVLDTLASEMTGEIGQVLQPTQSLRIHASHGFAIERLIERLQQDHVSVAISYGSSSAAAAAFHDGACDLAGLHIPLGELQDTVLAHYERWLGGEDAVIIDIAERVQGLMVAPGNPRGITGLTDLHRSDVRFISRQPGSGTRLLLDGLLRVCHLDPAGLAGHERGEYTHAAVAAYVASGMADCGFGLEAPARRFGLHFLPLAHERYFLLCRRRWIDTAPVKAVLAILQEPAFHQHLGALAGYDPTHAGRVVGLSEAYPALGESAASH